MNKLHFNFKNGFTKKARKTIYPLGVLALFMAVVNCSCNPIEPNNAPVIEAQTFTVAEDIADTVVIGVMQASDVEGDSLTFSIIENSSPSGVAIFEVVETNGELSLAVGQILDYETTNFHQITVQVSDGQGTGSANITINVSNIDAILEAQSFTVAEDITNTEVIGLVQASNTTLIFSIITNSQSPLGESLFEIVETTGEISLAPGQMLDYEITNLHRIVVQVSNDSVLATAGVTINVTNIFDSIDVRIMGDINANETNVINLVSQVNVSNGTSYFWEQVNPPAGRPPATISTPTNSATEIILPYVEDPVETLIFRLSVSNGTFVGSNDHSITVTRGNIDLDEDGLIDIRGITMLHNMRYNIGDGDSYKTGAGDTGVTSGCPSDVCRGYELLYDLSFDADGDGSTWTSNGDGTYALDMDDNHPTYFNVTNGGWLPIGVVTGDLSQGFFVTIFEGNGHQIIGLARVDVSSVARTSFAFILSTAQPSEIRRVGLVGTLMYNTVEFTGGLVGTHGGVIIDSYVSGDIVGIENVGGLVGSMERHSQSIGTNLPIITASYFTGNVIGNERVGGLIGDMSVGIVTANYVTGNVISGQNVGGFAGQNTTTRKEIFFTANYTTANVTGTNTTGGFIGILLNSNAAVANYATGSVSGMQNAGAFIGGPTSTIVIESYGFGVTDIDGGTNDNVPNALGPPPVGITNASELTAANAGVSWTNSPLGLGAWNFDMKATANGGGPALNYADYDGIGSIYHCEDDAENAPVGAILVPNCGELIPGQR